MSVGTPFNFSAAESRLVYGRHPDAPLQSKAPFSLMLIAISIAQKSFHSTYLICALRPYHPVLPPGSPAQVERRRAATSALR